MQTTAADMKVDDEGKIDEGLYSYVDWALFTGGWSKLTDGRLTTALPFRCLLPLSTQSSALRPRPRCHEAYGEQQCSDCWNDWTWS